MRAGVVPAVAAGSVPGGESWATLVTTPSRIQAEGAETVQLLRGTGNARLIVLDQLEEIFTSLPSDDRAALGKLLRRLLDDPSTRVVATVRSDFLDQTAAWPPLRSALAESLVFVTPP